MGLGLSRYHLAAHLDGGPYTPFGCGGACIDVPHEGHAVPFGDEMLAVALSTQGRLPWRGTSLASFLDSAPQGLVIRSRGQLTPFPVGPPNISANGGTAAHSQNARVGGCWKNTAFMAAGDRAGASGSVSRGSTEKGTASFLKSSGKKVVESDAGVVAGRKPSSAQSTSAQAGIADRSPVSKAIAAAESPDRRGEATLADVGRPAFKRQKAAEEVALERQLKAAHAREATARRKAMALQQPREAGRHRVVTASTRALRTKKLKSQHQHAQFVHQERLALEDQLKIMKKLEHLRAQQRQRVSAQALVSARSAAAAGTAQDLHGKAA